MGAAASCAEGRTVIGHKIGLTSRAMQQPRRSPSPTTAAARRHVLRDGGDIAAARFIVPRFEVELAFVLGRPLQGPGRDALRRARRHRLRGAGDRDHRCPHRAVRPRRPRRRARCFDTIADNAANAGIVLGGRPVRPDAVDLRWAGALLYKNGVIEETGLAAAVLNHPANGVAWLANKLAPYDESLDAGEIVLGGSFTRPGGRAAGDTFHADYGPLGVDLVAVRLSACHADARESLQAGARRAATRRSACGSAWPTPMRPRLCAGAGFDWLLIDGEHAPERPALDAGAAAGAVRARDPGPRRSSQPVVRIPHGDTALIKQVLDIGARRCWCRWSKAPSRRTSWCAAMRYPPQGMRGVGSGAGALVALDQLSGLPAGSRTSGCACWCRWRPQRRWRNRRHRCRRRRGRRVHRPGRPVGIDGPCSASRATPRCGRRSKAALARILAAGKAPGILAVDEALARRYIELGARFVAVGVDTSLLVRAAAALAARFKGGRFDGRSDGLY